MRDAVRHKVEHLSLSLRTTINLPRCILTHHYHYNSSSSQVERVNSFSWKGRKGLIDENHETGQIQAKGPSGEGQSPRVEMDEGPSGEG